MQSRSNDGFTQRFKAFNVQRDVVVDQENGSSPMVAGVANVGQHAVERVSVKIAAAHFDDRTKAAIVGAASRSLDHIHFPPRQLVSLHHARTTISRANL